MESKLKTKKTVAVCGKYPGPIGGTTILVWQMYESLRDSNRFNVLKCDLSVNAKIYSSKITRTFSIIFDAIKNADVSVFCVSKPGFEYLALLFSLLPTGKSIIVFRFFGGDTARLFSWMPEVIRIAALKRLARRVAILTETQANIKYFKAHGINVFQLTNSRKPVLLSNKARVLNKTELKIIFVSQIKIAKGIIDAIAAVEASENVKMDVYGPLLWDVSVEIFKGLKNVQYKGVLPLGTTQTVMQNYDALIFPTTYHGESHAGVIVEAYSAGLPVIAYAWSAIPEIVIHEKTGLLITPKDTAGLARAIQRLNADREFHGYLSESAYKFFQEHFTDNASNKRVESVLDFLLDSSASLCKVDANQLPLYNNVR